MPLVTLTVRKSKPAAFRSAVLEAVHQSLVDSGVPQADRFHRVLELDAGDFRFDPTYPDLQIERNDDFVLIEILWAVGRSVEVKKRLLQGLMERLAGAGIEPERVMVCFTETQRENWSFGGGRMIHA